ncbi:MAG: T9SS type A sorting domain-containing protein [Bacteroidota bacterium]
MKKIAIFLTFFYFVQILHASHNRAGEILYKRIAPFTTTSNGIITDVYTYSITVIKYTDDGATIADRCIDTVYFGDGTRTAVSRSNGTGTLSCQCSPLCGDIIQNLPGFRVKKNVYSAVHTYPGPGQYVVYSIDFGRNASIANIPNSLNQTFYIESLIVANSSIGNNSSPVLNYPPIDLATNVNCFYHQANAIDAEGDSISYQLIPCKGLNGQAINGYSNPPVNASGYFFMGTSGLISWCMPPSIGEYNIAFYVKEWRKNSSGVYQLIGLVERDLQVLVMAGVVGMPDESSNKNNLTVYPTPFSTQLSVTDKSDTGELMHADLLSLDGKLLMSGTLLDGKIDFSTKQLDNGLYLLKITKGETITYKKIFKSN